MATLSIRPARYLPVMLYGGLFVACAYILVTAQDPGAYVFGWLGALAGAVGLAHFGVYYRVEVRNGVLRQYRFFGLGDRAAPLASLTMVQMIQRRNYLGMAIPRICIRWPHDAICLTSSVYSERDIRQLIQCMYDAGVTVPTDVLRRFKLHAAAPLQEDPVR